MTDREASNWGYRMICCLGISTSNSDINVVGLHKTVKELYDQGRADEREAQVCCGDYEKCIKACTPRGRWLAEKELAKPKPTPRQLQRLRQEAWKNIKQDEYKFDPEVCFAMGFDAGYGAVASKVEPSQGECGGFDSRPAPLKEWVGLTDDERNRYISYTAENFSAGVLWAETKLRERNT